MLRFARAQEGDADAVAAVSARAFEDDIHYSAPPVGGPPGYKSAAWQIRMMRRGYYCHQSQRPPLGSSVQ